MRKIRALCRPLLPFHKRDDEDEGPGDPSPPTEEPQVTCLSFLCFLMVLRLTVILIGSEVSMFGSGYEP